MASTYLCLTLLAFLYFISNVQSQSSDCYTKKYRLGICIPVLNCKYYLDKFRSTHYTFHKNIHKTIIENSCGFKGRQQLVCCADEKDEPDLNSDVEDKPRIIDIDPINNEIVPINDYPDPPNIKNHPNLKLLPTECGEIGNNRILNGEFAGFTEFPWMALLSYKTDNAVSFRCGGSIINKKHILTAAHCVTNLKDATLVGVRVGEIDLRTNPDCDGPKDDEYCVTYQDISVEKAIPHPGFLRNSLDDIAIIKLKDPIIYDNNKIPICLPIDKNIAKENLTDKTLTVSGWGATNVTRSSPVLMKADLPVVEISECIKNTVGLRISHKHVCAGKPDGKDSAKGDSGGPLQRVESINEVQRYVQHALVSFGLKKYSFSPRVSYYMDWILDQLSP